MSYTATPQQLDITNTKEPSNIIIIPIWGWIIIVVIILIVFILGLLSAIGHIYRLFLAGKAVSRGDIQGALILETPDILNSFGTVIGRRSRFY